MDGIQCLVRKARRKIGHHGLRKAVCAALLKLVDQYARFNVLKVHYAEEVNPSLLRLPPHYSGSFVAPPALIELARDPEGELSADSLNYALAKGDKCFGFIRDGALRAYSWYASNPTRVSPRLRVSFSPNYIYMYRGFTHDAHRGKRLFAVGITRALKHYLGAGYRGMLLYVDAYNLDSLKSCAHVGFRVCGTVFIWKVFGHYFIFESPGCERFGFRIEDVSDGRGERVPARSPAQATGNAAPPR